MEETWIIAPRRLSIHAPELLGRLRQARPPFLRRLSSLDLSFNHLGDTSAGQLAACAALQNLTTLNLSHNDLCDTGVEELVTSPHRMHLEAFQRFTQPLRRKARAAQIGQHRGDRLVQRLRLRALAFA